MPADHRPPTDEIHLRLADITDVGALFDIENRLFSYDRLSRRSFRRLIASPAAWLAVARLGGAFAGYALVLFRRGSRIARLYSIAVSPAVAGRGVGPALLMAAEAAARRGGALVLRLEVQEHNTAAIRRYRKAGYFLFGQSPAYYDDGATALRYEKQLSPSSTGDENSFSTPRAPE